MSMFYENENQMTVYEVRHKEKIKRLEEKQEALNLAKALERFGYEVEVYMIKVKSSYENGKILIYKSL